MLLFADDVRFIDELKLGKEGEVFTVVIDDDTTDVRETFDAIKFWLIFVKFDNGNVGFLYISTTLKIMFKMIFTAIKFTSLNGYPFIKSERPWISDIEQ